MGGSHTADMSLTMIERFDLAQRRRGFAKATIRHRHGRLRLFIDWLDPVGVFDATSDDVERFIDSRKVSDRTRYSWLSTLHCFYRWAIHAGLTDHDPTASIDRPRLPRLLPRPIADDHLAAGLEHANHTMAAWLTLGAWAGLRCMEVAGLERADLLDNRIRVAGKGAKERLVPIHPKVSAALDQHGLPHRGPIFRRADGCRFSAWQVSHAVRAHFVDLEIEATMHQTRHWFGTQLYIATRDLRLVQEMMGHASPSTTAGYAAFASDTADAAVAALPVLG